MKTDVKQNGNDDEGICPLVLEVKKNLDQGMIENGIKTFGSPFEYATEIVGFLVLVQLV